jgi:lipoprotein NlpD
MRNRNPLVGLGQRVVMIGIAVMLAACASTTVVREEAPRAPTSSGPRPAPPSSRPSGPSYVVQAGDTLYGIAFRNRLDWREIARWNGIGEPYVIQPGQRLRLSAPRSVAAPAPVTPAPPTVAAGPPPMPRGPAGSAGAVAAPVPRPAVPTTSPPASAATAPVLAPAPPAAAPPTTTPASAPTGPSGTAAFRAGQWQWPTQGQVISRYAEGDKARQGIAIAGTAGQPVRAAAAGTVVYSGAGLVGYGELIIIKHSDEWLSAYGHNRRRLVAEGASISAGQQIAELGRTGTSRDMLHFEIRRNGKPVDPAPLLPRR